MGFEIVGAVYDESGRPIELSEMERMVLEKYGIESGALFVPRTPMIPQRAAGPTFSPQQLMQLGRNPTTAARRVVAEAIAPQVVQTAPGPVDEVPLPVESTGNVAAGASAVITVTSQIIFQPRRLIIPPSLAPFFVVSSIMVGNVPLFAGSGNIPGEVFTPDSVGANVRKTTATPGLGIVITVQNIDAVGHAFRAVLFGLGAQPSGCGG